MRTWIYTNPRTLETYRFRKEGNVIITEEFLGYRTPNGKLIKP